MRHLNKLVFPVLLAGFAASAGAQVLMDPTRPPAALAATGGEALVTSGPVLQSVMLSQGRKVAMISGEMVTLGGR